MGVILFLQQNATVIIIAMLLIIGILFLLRKFRKKKVPVISVTSESQNLVTLLKDYISKARASGFSDEVILNKFKEKGYSQSIINSSFDIPQLPEIPSSPMSVKKVASGFAQVYDKIKNSDYVKGIQEEQQSADSDEFTTDFSQLTKVEL